MKLSELIRERRIAKGLTQQQLAERIGREQNFISSIEIGRTKRPSSENLRLLKEALDISSDELREAIRETSISSIELDLDFFDRSPSFDQSDPYVQSLLDCVDRMTDEERQVLESVARMIVRNRSHDSVYQARLR